MLSEKQYETQMKKSLLNPDEALRIILDGTSKLDTESLSLSSVLDRVLAEDVYADQDLPPFDNSAMDGYAVLAEDTKGAKKETPRALRVLAEEPAGVVVDQEVVAGGAVRIMTGAPIPPGADSVVPVEDTFLSDNARVCVCREAALGAHIRRSGEDVTLGQLVLAAGVRIGPSELGMLAAVGKAEVLVYKRPRVAIVTTGDEIVDVTEKPGPGQIRDSNSFAVLGQTLRCGAEVSLIRRVSDERAELERVLTLAAETSDMMITTGGVSVGDYDFVKDTLARLGEIHFWKIAMKPGKPLAYGQIAARPLFGLPGNPVSSMVTFDLFVRPALLRMSGVEDISRPTVSATVTRDLRHKIGRREFVRAKTVWKDGGYVAEVTGGQGSGRMSSMLGANSYVVVPEDIGDIRNGDTVNVMLFSQ